MIATLRLEISDLKEQIEDWLNEINVLNDNIEEARADIASKEAQIEELQQDEARKAELFAIIQNADLTVEQLETLVAGINNSENTETTDGVDSDDVTFDMLTDEMHNAMITLVGTKYQDLWNVHNRSPEIGDTITLAKKDGIRTQNTVGYTIDEISVGILPASEDKFAQLERIGATSINNRDVDLDNPILERAYKVVGVIPGAFVFLDPIYDEAENIEETVAEAVSQIDAPRHRLVHTAENVDEARHIFNEEMPDHCRIHNIIEQDDCFVINYENHRANTTAEYYQTVEVERAE